MPGSPVPLQTWRDVVHEKDEGFQARAAGPAKKTATKKATPRKHTACRARAGRLPHRTAPTQPPDAGR
ncbi:hypothetical protein [Streptomyces sp. NPDC058664]|uniref:hypothetical protein n=1 Tax=unclassified Streptomyces TaxID=2593676 RepID=UPI00365DC30B